MRRQAGPTSARRPHGTTDAAVRGRALSAALTAQLITLAAVIFGGWIAVQIFSASGSKTGTTVNIRKA
ncbi:MULTISPECIES: hypothetical protein [unclassified Streptomyces]|uniref:hypothetical protein n=1 Tax=unclassified Streptomyces TaxID=2593676 RepID=UPI00224F5FE4|nr:MULTISPECIES: hypothetical protein [unclassified Streptomyces]MCX4990117.1 hypothetical protein [Streptomyces sp. NBC_00568]MCX5004653.1 hypothetical protein [Streptomyces sp. NBC_00638]